MRPFARLVISMAFLVASAWAHPGWGIVVDTQGQVYFTDLAQVWKLDAAGQRTIFVPHVHSHELYLGADGNLYGEHLFYNAPQRKFQNYYWMATPQGKVSQISADAPQLKDVRFDRAFVRDATGDTYTFNEDAVVRIRSGQSVTKVASGLVDPIAFYDPAGGGEFNRLLGLAMDDGSALYVANFGNRRLQKISPGGSVDVVLRSGLLWGPSGIAVARDGLFILESGIPPLEAVRVLRLAPSGEVTVLATVVDPVTYAVVCIGLATLAIMIAVVVLLRKVVRRRRVRTRPAV